MEFTNQYLTYEEYTSIGGSLSKDTFNLLEYEAQKEIDKYTFNRLTTLTTQLEDTKLCINALINHIKEYNDTSYRSESSDGYSLTYNRPATADENKNRYSIIETYLINDKLEDGTPYMYCG